MIGSALFVLALGAAVGLSFLFEYIFFDKSIEWIEKMQEKDSFFDVSLHIIGYGGESPGVITTTFVLLAILPYSESVFLLFVVFISSYLSGFLKMLHHDARPYWVSDDVQALMCNTSYANPSGHALYFAAFVPSLFYVGFYGKTNGLYSLYWNNFRNTTGFKVFYVAIIVLMVGIGFPSMFGRLYLGAHTLDQLIYGFMVGGLTFLYCCFVLRPPFMKYIVYFVEGRCTKKEAIINLLMIIALIGFLFVINIIIYFINTTTFEDPLSWRQALDQKCDISGVDIEDDHVFANKNMGYMFSPSSSPACLIGVILYSWLSSHPINRFHLLPVWKTIIRMVLNAIFMLPLAPLALIPSSAPNIVSWIFVEFLLTFSFSILAFSSNKYFLRK